MFFGLTKKNVKKVSLALANRYIKTVVFSMQALYINFPFFVTSDFSLFCQKVKSVAVPKDEVFACTNLSFLILIG